MLTNPPELEANDDACCTLWAAVPTEEAAAFTELNALDEDRAPLRAESPPPLEAHPPTRSGSKNTFKPIVKRAGDFSFFIKFLHFVMTIRCFTP
ncbi:MAG: hypothetical protein AXA67_10705 [Methylothermaceae bacteria B42]|nr:MAG: hypothetical protein AXA67_10705 [Methylothermaceae bacteria B42]